jgi:hypothetical protein
MRYSGRLVTLVVALIAGVLVASPGLAASAGPPGSHRPAGNPRPGVYVARSRVPDEQVHRPRWVRRPSLQAARPRHRREIPTRVTRRPRRSGLGATWRTQPGAGSGKTARRNYSAVRATATVILVHGTINGSVTWSPPSIYEVDGPLTIASSGILTIQPGTVVHVDNGEGLSVRGSLHATGTSASSITFSPTTNPQPGDWSGISVSGAGSVNLQHATVGYAGFTSQSSKAMTLVSDKFVDSNGGAVYLDDGQSDKVENNSVVNPGGVAYAEQGPAVNFGLLSGNTASGTGARVFVVAGTAVSSTWVAQPIPWSLGDGCGPCGLDVPAGVTVTANPGVVVKSYGEGLSVEGTLSAVGTAASPIVMTSLWDTSIDGNSTGTATNPQPGDWSGISVSGAGSVNLQHATVGYADTGFYSNSSSGSALNATNLANNATGIDVTLGAVAMRGNVTGSSQAAVACAWDSGTTPCSIDAAYTYWGSKGPLTGGAQVCGSVTVSPYLTATGSALAADASVPACGGGSSSSPSATLIAAEASANQFVGNEQIQCNNGFQDACQAIQQYEHCFAAAVNLAAQSSPFPPPSKTSAPTYASELLGAAGTWLQSFEGTAAKIGEALGDATEIYDAFQTILDIANAYNSCS